MAINRRQAIEAMLAGKTVRAINPLYLNHTRPPLFRWNEQCDYIEWSEYGLGDNWKISRNSFYLTREFQVV